MSWSPTQKSLELLREQGFQAAVVEKRNPKMKFVTHDLFGFIDILGVRDGETIAVQATSRTNVSSRLKKIREHENLPAVLAAGWRVEVHGWERRKEPRIETVEG